MPKKIIPFLKKHFFYFLFVGSSVGFPLGLLMLTNGPSRYIANLAKSRNWSLSIENSIQKIVILLFLVLVGIVSYHITKFLVKNKNKRKGIITILILLLFCSIYIFSFRPELLISVNKDTAENIETQINTEFHFGSYPDEEKMIQLKKENFTIVSLLSPLVVPAEPLLIKKEEELANKIGIKIISIPMLPWITDNDAAITKIKKLAHTANGKYYVHCYLGKDRANVFKNIIQSENNSAQIKGNVNNRNIGTHKSFERGKIIKLNNRSYITPFPTDEEFFSYVLNGSFKTVVCILPSNNETRTIIEKEKKTLLLYNINYAYLPIKNDKKNIGIVIDSLKKLPKPVLIHAYNDDSVETKILISTLTKNHIDL